MNATQQQKKVYKFSLNFNKGQGNGSTSYSRNMPEGSGAKSPTIGMGGGGYNTQSAQNLPKVSMGQGTKMNLLNRQSQSPPTNNAASASNSKKYMPAISATN